MIDTIMDGAKCVNLQDNFSLSNFQHDYVKPFPFCWKMLYKVDKWASPPSKCMGATKIGGIRVLKTRVD